MHPETDPRLVAGELFQRAYARQMDGDYDEAIALYTKSIEVYPTAEAYTFRGWAYSFQKDYDSAIAECRKALEIDPKLGNPYNDIGAYLIELERWNEAIGWLEMATMAPRYDARCYPYYNLGRVWEHKRDWVKAKFNYRRAFEENQQYRLALVALKRVIAMWN